MRPLCYIHLLGPRAFQIVSRSGLAWLKCAKFSRYRWLLHAFSTRQGGVSRAPAAGLNLGFTDGEQRARVEQNRWLFFAQLGAASFALASLRQIHSPHVYQVTRAAGGRLEYRFCGIPFPEPCPETPPAGDALMTDDPGILLSVRSADCLPVVLVDSKRRAVAVIHAGWRGLLARVIEKTVGEMRRLFGSEPRRLLAALGPSIRTCCYEVGEEVLEAFHGRFPQAEKFFCQPPNPSRAWAERPPAFFLPARPPAREPRAAPTAHLDLVAGAQEQLRNAALNLSNVSVADFCTACRTDLFFSHRKEGRRTGRSMAVVGIRPDAPR